MEMTREEAIKIMENEVRCVRNPNCERLECRNCYLVMPEHKVLKAYEVAIKALEQEPCGDAISRQWLMECVNEGWIKFDTEKDKNIFIHLVRDIAPSVTPQTKTGHWVYKIYGEFHEQGDWYCSHCDYPFNYGYGHAEYCPKCGCKMSETPTEEVIGDRDYDWIIKR